MHLKSLSSNDSDARQSEFRKGDYVSVAWPLPNGTFRRMANDLANKTSIVPDFEHAVLRHQFLDLMEKSATQGGIELVS